VTCCNTTYIHPSQPPPAPIECHVFLQMAAQGLPTTQPSHRHLLSAKYYSPHLRLHCRSWQAKRYATHDFKTSPKSHLFLDILVYSVTELETSIDLVRQHKTLQQHGALQSGFFLLDCTAACPWNVRYLVAEKMIKMRNVCSGEVGELNPDGTSAGLKVWAVKIQQSFLWPVNLYRINFKNRSFSISLCFPEFQATDSLSLSFMLLATQDNVFLCQLF
jgi:hypothetical protein